MQKLTIDIDDSLLQAAEAYASEHHTTLSHLVQTQLAQLIGLDQIESRQSEPEQFFPKTDALWIMEKDETPLPPEGEESFLDKPVVDNVEDKIAEMFSQLLKK